MRRVTLLLGLAIFAEVAVAQQESRLLAPATPGQQGRPVNRRPDAASIRSVLGQVGSLASIPVEDKQLSAQNWVGPCFEQSLPYQGSFDATSVWWGARVSQPTSATCVEASPTPAAPYVYFDFWSIPAAPGDVFDIVFSGGHNAAVSVNDYFSTSHMWQYATVANSNTPGEYITGWIGFTIPATWARGQFNSQGVGYFEIIVAHFQAESYLIGAIKRLPTAPSCANSTTLCLAAARFKVSVAWQTGPVGGIPTASGNGSAISLTGDTGYFWFFDSSNVEVVVKVLDARSVNTHFWVFAGGLTNVRSTVSVTDTVTGVVRTYVNPQGVAFQPVQDTNAFNP